MIQNIYLTHIGHSLVQERRMQSFLLLAAEQVSGQKFWS